jgi:hypothetical protein
MVAKLPSFFSDVPDIEAFSHLNVLFLLSQPLTVRSKQSLDDACCFFAVRL